MIVKIILCLIVIGITFEQGCWMLKHKEVELGVEWLAAAGIGLIITILMFLGKIPILILIYPQ